MRSTLYGIIILFALTSCGQKSGDISPSRRTVIEAVYAGGTIHPKYEYKAFANVTGIMRDVYAREGDSVSVGSLLFTIDARDPSAREQSARESLAFAENNSSPRSALLDELQANIEIAYEKNANDSLAFSRIKNLYETNTASKSEYDRAAFQLSQSLAQLAAARSKYKSSRANLDNQLAMARRQMELASIFKENFITRSLINGRVFSVYKEPGEIVNSQQPVAILGDSKHFLLRLVVDQTDISRIRTGQETLYTIDAIPDSIFSAKIIKIYPALDLETQSYRVDAECAITPLAPYLGTQVQANIIIRRKENALVIPRGYVQPDGSVLVKNDGTIRPVKIISGARDLDYVEVLSGLNENDIIVPKK